MYDISIELLKQETEFLQPLMSGKSNKGNEIGVNKKFLYRDGEPWFPIMGEFHYSRYPKEYWRESLLKIKAGGVDILATYIFWIHHEEIEGQFDWNDRRDLRYFIELCNELDINVFLRIGPWAHGEVRNGGFPDWLLKKDFEPRTNDDKYFSYVKKLYAEIFSQVKGLLFKDGGPVIGIQIENEFGHCGGLKGEAGKQHMGILRKIAQKTGFDVPLYTATGWGGAIVVEGEMIPVMGAYADAAWEQHLNPLSPNQNYIFRSNRDDSSVGTDLAKDAERVLTFDPEKFPYLTAELGGGMQVTYHRRPVITADDTEVMALVKLGSGANLLGYYMYHGGSNPEGRLTTLQESRETGYLNDLPEISYDFQAPVGEFGQITDSYKYLRILHTFLKDFGSFIAKTQTVIPCENIKPEDTESLRYSIRHKDGSGFLFLNNYQKGIKITDKNDIIIDVIYDRDKISFNKLSLKSGRHSILPFNLNLMGVVLRYSTAQLLCKIANEGEHFYFFYSYKDNKVRYTLAKSSINEIYFCKDSYTDEEDNIYLDNIKPGLESIVTIKSQNGETVNIITLTRENAENLQKVEVWGRKRVIISNKNFFTNNGKIQFFSSNDGNIEFLMFPKIDGKLYSEKEKLIQTGQGIFRKYSIEKPSIDKSFSINQVDDKYGGSRVWNITFQEDLFDGVNDIFLKIDYEGDVAKIFLDDKLIADNFNMGVTWNVGLKRFAKMLKNKKLTLKISPLTNSTKVYMDRTPKLESGAALSLDNVQLIPEYKTIISKE